MKELYFYRKLMAMNFTRMNGLGNDFLIYDARKQADMSYFSHDNILQLCSRNNTTTKGCDQLIILGNSNVSDVSMLVYNSDGSEVYACGNATRCVVSLLEKEKNKNTVTIQTKAAILSGKTTDEKNMVAVDMDEPVFDWKKIPLAKDVDVENLPIAVEGFAKPFAVNMGNPHMVFTTDIDVESIDVKGLGKTLEYHPLYPQRANVGFAQVVDSSNISLRVFERGAGETPACGTGACAAAVAAISRGLCGRNVQIKTHGGMIGIEWRKTDNRVIMTGSVELEGVVAVATGKEDS